jgi:hypothetical protein
MPKRIVQLILPAIIAFGCSSAEAQKRPKAAIDVQRLPEPVVIAAHSAVKDLQIVKAKQRHKKEEIVYKLDGLAGGKEYEFKITADGRILDMEQEDADRSHRDDAAPEAVIDTPFELTGTITHAPIRESSGVAASRRFPGVIWTHNDKGNSPSLYAIDKNGKLLAEYLVAAVNDDWEDIALDDQGRIYIGKIGNNKAKKDRIEVLRLAEPNPANRGAEPDTLDVERTYLLSFPEQPFDCEAMFIHQGHGYVISKQFNNAPAGLYRFPLERGHNLQLEKVADLPIRGPVTSADLSANGRLLAILTYGTLYTFQIDGDINRLATAKPQPTPAPAGKTEGICFTPDGLLMTAESRQVYVLSDDKRQATLESRNP